MHTLHVQDVAMADLYKSKYADLDAKNFDDEDQMRQNDLVDTLFKCGDNICLAVLEVHHFSFPYEKSSKTVAAMDELERPDKHITISGHVIDLWMPSGACNYWHWTGKHLQLDTIKNGQKLTQRHYKLDVPSHLVCPLALI